MSHDVERRRGLLARVRKSPALASIAGVVGFAAATVVARPITVGDLVFAPSVSVSVNEARPVSGQRSVREANRYTLRIGEESGGAVSPDYYDDFEADSLYPTNIGGNQPVSSYGAGDFCYWRGEACDPYGYAQSTIVAADSGRSGSQAAFFHWPETNWNGDDAQSQLNFQFADGSLDLSGGTDEFWMEWYIRTTGWEHASDETRKLLAIVADGPYGVASERWFMSIGFDAASDSSYIWSEVWDGSIPSSGSLQEYTTFLDTVAGHRVLDFSGTDDSFLLLKNGTNDWIQLRVHLAKGTGANAVIQVWVNGSCIANESDLPWTHGFRWAYLWGYFNDYAATPPGSINAFVDDLSIWLAGNDPGWSC